MNIIHKSFAIGLVAAGMGCATATLPTEQLSTTEASVRAAEELGAQSVPKAELHLRLAKEEVAAARKFADNGDEDLGKMQLARAKADAELAVALSREATAQQSLQGVSQSAVTSPQPAVQAER
ncbi:MAG TPA: DUF4398 domain-containing protein [Polyangiales bacterium]|jgi:hypothetical protein